MMNGQMDVNLKMYHNEIKIAQFLMLGLLKYEAALCLFESTLLKSIYLLKSYGSNIHI